MKSCYLCSVTMARHKDVVDLMLFTTTSFERRVAKTLAASLILLRET